MMQSVGDNPIKEIKTQLVLYSLTVCLLQFRS